MSLQTVVEKLQIKDEKNLLIQGLPSSIEKQFIKISFAKSVTPLLRARKIDFALIFAISKKQLNDILADVVPALQPEARVWIAYPKLTSKIASDLSRDSNLEFTTCYGFSGVCQVALDNVWCAVRLQRKGAEVSVGQLEMAPAETLTGYTVSIPDEMKMLFKKNKSAGDFFENLSSTNKQEYVEWVVGAKKQETRERRLGEVLEKLITGKKTPSSK